MHGKKKPGQPQVMITVEVADKNMGDFMDVDAVARELKLYAFTTVNQKMFVLNREILRGGESAVGR